MATTALPLPRLIRRSAHAPWVLIGLSVAVAAVLALPLVFLIVTAHNAGASEVWHLIDRRLTATLLWNTVRLSLVVTALCAVIGTAAAYFVERRFRTSLSRSAGRRCRLT
jgi:iron(III) transport system permease protein